MSAAEPVGFVDFSAKEIGRMAIARVLAERGLPPSTPCNASLNVLPGGIVTLTVEIGASPASSSGVISEAVL